LDVFVRRIGSPSIQRVSVALDGSTGGNGVSSFGQFAGHSNRVVFASVASNLVARDTNGVEDVFVRDLQTGITRLLSVAPDGSFANGASTAPLVTAGRWVLFDSLATNLTGRITAGNSQVHLHDLSTGLTELAALGQGNALGELGTFDARISDDGRWLAFTSRSTNLVTDFQSRATDLYVRDRSNGGVRQLGLGPISEGAVSGGFRVRSFDLSPDGRYVAMVLGGGRYRIGDTTNGAPFALWHDLESDVVRAVTPPGVVSATDSIRLVDGGRRVFVDALPVGESTSRVMAWDEANGLQAMEQLSLTLPPVGAACTNSELVDVTADGGRVVIASPQALGGIPAAGIEGQPMLYEWSVITGRTRLLTAGKGGEPMPLVGMPGAALSPDGLRVLFETAGALVDGDFNRSLDVFVGNEGSGVADLLSFRDPGVPVSTAGGGSTLPARALSEDGRWVVFTSFARDLVHPPVEGALVSHLFLRDLELGVHRWISRPVAGRMPTSGTITEPMLTRDGRRVLFSSTRGDLVTDDTNGVSDVFLYDRSADALRAVSARSGGGGTGSGASTLVAVDAAGRRVLIESQAGDLASIGTTGRNVFLHDVDRGTTTLISTNTSTPQGLLILEGASRGGTISEDGRWMAFLRSSSSSGAGELVVRNEEGQILRVEPLDTSVLTPVLAPDGSRVAYVRRNGGTSFGIRVRRLPGLELVRDINVGSAGSRPRSLAFTPDSRRLLLTTTHPLAAADTNNFSDVYLVGVEDDSVDWVSSGIAGEVPRGHSDQPSISRDGRVVAFRSWAPNVALGAAAESSQVMVRDFSSGLTWRISVPTQPGVREPSSGVLVSGDGRSAVFQSFGVGLVAGDFNDSQDVFLASLVSPATVDSDGDGLPDAWELWNLGSLTSTGLQDNDGDGVANFVEHRTGTHPGQATSRLELGLPAYTADGVAVAWSAVPGVPYVLERADEMGEPWVTVERVPASSGGVTRVTDVPTDGAIYRVVVPSSTPN
jgi:Tol biopolymer transport system component